MVQGLHTLKLLPKIEMTRRGVWLLRVFCNEIRNFLKNQMEPLVVSSGFSAGWSGPPLPLHWVNTGGGWLVAAGDRSMIPGTAGRTSRPSTEKCERRESAPAALRPVASGKQGVKNSLFTRAPSLPGNYSVIGGGGRQINVTLGYAGHSQPRCTPHRPTSTSSRDNVCTVCERASQDDAAFLRFLRDSATCDGQTEVRTCWVQLFVDVNRKHLWELTWRANVTVWAKLHNGDALITAAVSLKASQCAAPY